MNEPTSKYVKPGSDSPGNGAASSVSELQHQLEAAANAANKLLESQAGNKRQQENLKQAIESIAKNVAEFDKDGSNLSKQFKTLSQQIATKRKCVHEQLGSSAVAIDQSLTDLDNDSQSNQDQLTQKEALLLGSSEIESRSALRKATREKKRFDSLLFKSLTDRVSQAQALFKEAGAISGESPSDVAAAYTLLWLADEKLSYSFLESDFVVERVEFKFPENYEKELVTASAIVNQHNESLLASQQNLLQTKADFEQQVKRLATIRSTRKDKAIADAPAVISSPAPSKYQKK